ncbi:16S rRNA (cytosine(1402)-N(4))-methyltransferase [Synechococcus sp. BIOS-U3-1]|uniref:16S rRNA (cytosine(1402)-N(4))-methyltransferase RsmH n=1 Tax=Synechococcus sp. BIOS-U3-1 TaxID=1400865 RepID=UPI000C682D26|nr:16S rRNA (cytosine(1402)-N(4))-methyltransferase RsmH [Synechococcus sp. BIOS-U3-1]MAD67902.1 16S rRNA (cytosine(1402)-N(4))-methyltransferase [Synechococcus sp. CPC100]QNI60060.1 16S rRNA (cytosine(1402)-N(4))-methyltransferase [Synechococcus sp. BIOS-U3-1]|tara:strand:+ start:73 stop:1020 length:948 start_codon:yes stop_codon:yes gene_type:complete
MPDLLASPAQGFMHVPVLAEPLMQTLAVELCDQRQSGVFIDATLGGGGHSGLLLDRYPKLRLLGLDHDPTARLAAAERLELHGDRVTIVATNFADYTPPRPVALVLADLGVSSPQLDVAQRGFSFRLDGPLDMRMNQAGGGETAADLIARLDESDLADLIYAYGEERLSRRIARRIKADLDASGAYAGTAALAYAVAGCYPPKARRGRIHPATRTFQALRVAVNDELAVLDRLLQQAPDWLQPDGLLAIISFHSLEDRRVKTAFLSDERLQRVTRKPLRADEAEQLLNPRSRSAKLRIARRRPPDPSLTEPRSEI